MGWKFLKKKINLKKTKNDLKNGTNQQINIIKKELETVKQNKNNMKTINNKKTFFVMIGVVFIMFCFIGIGLFIVNNSNLKTVRELDKEQKQKEYEEWINQYDIVQIDSSFIENYVSFFYYDGDVYYVNNNCTVYDFDNVGEKVAQTFKFEEYPDGEGYLMKNGSAYNILDGCNIYKYNSNSDILLLDKVSQLLQNMDYCEMDRYRIAYKYDDYIKLDDKPSFKYLYENNLIDSIKVQKNYTIFDVDSKELLDNIIPIEIEEGRNITRSFKIFAIFDNKSYSYTLKYDMDEKIFYIMQDENEYNNIVKIINEAASNFDKDSIPDEIMDKLVYENYEGEDTNDADVFIKNNVYKINSNILNFLLDK